MNRIFRCQNKKTGENVLIRLYGGKLLMEGNILRPGCIDIEVLAFYTMAQQGIGPQLYGVFPGGRLEEYIANADILSDDDCKDVQLMRAFARKLAQIHCMDLPITRSPRDFLGVAKDILSSKWQHYVSLMKETEIPATPESDQALAMLEGYDIVATCNWFMEQKVRSRIVLTHGDMNRGNQLVRKDETDPDKRLVILDFEFTSYSYRGMDFGLQFKARTMNMQKFLKDAPGSLVQIPYPSEDERRDFVRAYIDELKNHTNSKFDESIDNEEHLLLEAEFYGAVYDLYLLAWMVKDSDKIKSIFAGFPVHPALMNAGMIKGLQDRKELVIDLMSRVE